MTAEKCEVQADGKSGTFPRQSNGFVESRFIHHQACRSQNALAMSAEDGLVDGGTAAEVVGIHDEAARERRKSCAGRGSNSDRGTCRRNCKLEIRNWRFQTGSMQESYWRWKKALLARLVL